MGKGKDKLFGNTLDNLVKRAEDELKKYYNSLNNNSSSSLMIDDKSSKKFRKSNIALRYVVKNVPPEIQEFIQFFTKHEVWTIEGIFRKNSSVKDLKNAKKIMEEEGKLNLDKYEKEDAILVSGLFKNFLAEISGRIIPYKMYLKLKEATSDAEIKEVLRELPLNNYETLNYINQFILIVNDHCETNYMNLSNLSIVIGPNLFELTNDEMINLNITVVSSEIYKNILKIRKYERDTAEGLISNESIAERNDNDSMLMKNLDSSLNVISELPQSHTSINEVLNNAANVNLTRRNSKIKTIFIDHIKEKIQKRRSSISISALKSEKRKSDLREDNDSERLRSDEYRGYEIFNMDDVNSVSKLEPLHWNKSNYEGEEEEFKHHFVESSDDSCNYVNNQDPGFFQDNNNMETICEESYDSLVNSRTINKNSSDMIHSKNTNAENQGTKEQKKFQHNAISNNSEDKNINEIENSDECMSCISSIDDTESIIKQKTKINRESLYFDAEGDDSDDDSEQNNETIEIIDNNNKQEENDESKNKNKNNDNEEEINNYLTNEDIIKKLKFEPSKEAKRKKFNTIGPKSSIKFMLEREESNLKDAMSTTNLNDGENDPSEFLNKKLNNHKNDKTSLSKNFSRMIKTSKNTFESNMAFVNKTFEGSDEIFDSRNNDDNDDDDNYANSNYSIFYDKIDNNSSTQAIKNKSYEDSINDNNEEYENDEEYLDGNENIENNESSDESEIIKRQFVPLKGNDSDDENENKNELNEKENNNTEDNLEENNNIKDDLEENNNIVENNNEKEDIEKTDNKDDENTDLSSPVDESIYDNIKEYVPSHEKTNSFSGNKKRSSKKYSKRNPKCISKSSAAALSMIHFDFENIDVDKVNDNDLDNLDFNKMKMIKNEKSSILKNKNSVLSEFKSEYFSCEDVENKTNKSKINNELDFDIVNEKKQNNNSIQSIPKSPAKPAPPPPSYSKLKNKSSLNTSISEIFDLNIEKNTKEGNININNNDNNDNNNDNNNLISNEIKKRLEYKRKKDNRPEDLNKMTLDEIMKEKKAIKQELLLLKSVYSHHTTKNDCSTPIPNNSNNDFVGKSLLKTMESSIDNNNINSKINENSQDGRPPLNYNNNNKVISKKLEKEDIKYMKELYQKYAEIKFLIAKKNMEMDNEYEDDTAISLEKLKQEKLALQIKLKNFQEEFVEKNGRPIKTLEDQKPIRQDYLRYKELKKILQSSSSS